MESGDRGGQRRYLQRTGVLDAMGLGGEFTPMDEDSKVVRYAVPLGQCSSHNQRPETLTDFCSTWFA